MGDAQHFRIAQEAFAQFQNGRAHGGGEHDSLAGFGGLLQNGFDVVAETHVQHFIGHVQHGYGNVVKAKGTALQVIDDSSRRAHNHLRALAQGPKLPFDGLAAVNGQNGHVSLVGGQPAEFFGNLNGQLARGTQHNGLNVSAGNSLFQDGQAECGGLAGSGLSLTHHVPPRQQRGNGEKLDRRGLFKSHVFNGFQEVGGQAEVFKRCVHGTSFA